MQYRYGEMLYGDEDGIDSLLNTCIYHAMTINNCAKICKIIAPLCDEMTPDGAIKWLERKVQQRIDGTEFRIKHAMSTLSELI